MTKVMGEGSLTKCAGCWSYLSEQRNPSLQILYMFFITGSIGTFMACGYDLLDATDLAPIHKQYVHKDNAGHWRITSWKAVHSRTNNLLN